MRYSVAELQEFIQQDVPKQKKRETTIFDIAGFPHYENVMSSCYAYFLNQEAGHLLSDVFMDTLLRLIKEKTGKELIFKTWEALTEVSTKSGKRIDILVAPSKDEPGPYIIIENKIYHWLHNDLQDYWDHCRCPESEKVGIVLTLKTEKIPEALKNKFINITHAEWTAAIREGLDKLNLDLKFQVYAQDFFTALDNLKNDVNMDDRIRFFFDNSAKINDLEKTKTQAHNFVLQQFRHTADKLGLAFSGSAYEYRYLEIPELKPHGVYYTIIFNNLLTEKRTLRVVIELLAKCHHHIKDFDLEIDKLHPQPRLLKNTSEHTGVWIQYLAKDYTFTPNEVESLGEALATHIRNDFQPIMNVITNVLKRETVPIK